MKYLSIYGHQGPLNHPPKILHPPTQKEIESYDFYYRQCVADILPYEPSPFIRESLGLPLLPLLISSTEILRPPSRFFGHHNQVLIPEPQPQTTRQTVKVLHTPALHEPTPQPQSQRIEHLLTLCQQWGIPLQGALYFLVWENRRLNGQLIYSPNELRRLNEFLDFDGAWQDRFRV